MANGTDGSQDNTGGGALTAVNPQILSAVSTTNSTVLQASQDTGQGVAYQKVSQACAFSVQDATDYMRNVMTVALTAQGIALKLMIEKKDPSYAPILTIAQQAVTQAQVAFTGIGTAASQIATTFPSGA